jgi:hypothetical protein
MKALSLAETYVSEEEQRFIQELLSVISAEEKQP